MSRAKKGTTAHKLQALQTITELEANVQAMAILASAALDICETHLLPGGTVEAIVRILRSIAGFER